MKDNTNFGLSQSLMDAVRKVVKESKKPAKEEAPTAEPIEE